MLGSAQVVNILCGVVRSKLIAIWLGPAGFGLNSILNNGATLISSTTQLSIRDSAVRDVAIQNDKDSLALKCAVIRRCSLILGLIGAIAIVLLSPLLSIFSFSGSTDHWPSFALLAPFVFSMAYASGEYAILQGCSELKLMAKLNAIAVIAALIVSIPLLYFYRIDAIVAVLNISGISLALCLFARRLKFSTAIKSMSLRKVWENSRGFLKLGLSMSISVSFMAAAQYILTSYINSADGEAALGIYQSGHTLMSNYIGIIFSTLALEYYPRLTRFISRRRTCRTIIGHELGLIVNIVTPVAVIFIFTSRYIIQILYSSDFEAVLPYVNLAMVGCIFRGVALCYTYRILASGDARTYLIVEFISTVVGLTLNIAFYHFWSYTGLGFAFILWYGIYAAMNIIVCRRRYETNISSNQILKITAAIALTLFAVYLR